MSKHFHILLWIPLLYVTLFFSYWIQIYVNEVISFEEFVLDKQSNYAAESAVDAMLQKSDLNLDYSNLDQVTLEPSVAVDDYAHTFCLNFGYIPTDYNMNLVKNDNIRTFVVAGYDGVYAFYKMQTETNSYELKQTPKIPYFYTDAETGTQYCLTLNPNKGYWDYMLDGNYKLHQSDTYSGVKKPSVDRQSTAINDQVANTINWALYESYSAGQSGLRIELPATGETVRGEQSVKTPTVIAITEGNLKAYDTIIVAESIGGAATERLQGIVAYNLDGNNPGGLKGKFYAYEWWWAEHTSWLNNDIKNSGKYYSSVFEAAKDGYNDLNLIE